MDALRWILVFVVAFMAVVCGIGAFIFARFYIKPAPGTALIVTGQGGMRAATGGGMFCYFDCLTSIDPL